MRFTGERQVLAPVAEVWAALHDRDVLRSIIPGCEEMVPLDAGTYAATLRARVGPVTDTYRGSFSIEDLRAGSETRVRVGARGRCGRLEVSLLVALTKGLRPGTTALRYQADATVAGIVSRLGAATLTVAGGHFTSCFFRDLDRSLREGTHVVRLAPLVQRARANA
jgi:carbon monoxide dehydrogenase subunit G